MFTGIIEFTGRIGSFEPLQRGARMRVEKFCDDPLKRGESIAVNGVCLTALPNADNSFDVDISDETLRLTTLHALQRGDRVNLERAMMMGQRFGGHIVQGHVDTTGTLVEVRREGEFAYYRWSFPVEYRPLVVAKGSITVDGVSLTIVEPHEDSFAVALIPETLARTNIGASAVGALVNLEFDVMAKFVRQMIAPYLPSTGA